MEGLINGLIPGLIGAFATITAAYITRSYAINRVNSTPPTKSLDFLTSHIVHAIGSIKINAQVFDVVEHEAYVDSSIDFTLGFMEIEWKGKGFSARIAGAKISLTLPGGTPEEISNLNAGWSIIFEFKSKRIRLTLVKLSNPCTFELRELSPE